MRSRRRLFLFVLPVLWLSGAGLHAATQFIVTPTSVTVPEGGMATFTIRLDGDPSPDPVPWQIMKIGGDPELRVVGPVGGILNGTNWSTGIVVTLEALTDPDALAGSAQFEIMDMGSVFMLPPAGLTAHEGEAAAATGSPANPETQVAATVSRTATQTIQTFVMQQIFLQPVLPLSIQAAPVPGPGVPGPVPPADPGGPAPDQPGPPMPPATPQTPPAQPEEGRGPTQMEKLSGQHVLANQPAVGGRPTWDLTMNSAARYARTEYYDFGHSASDRMGMTLNSAHQWDRWQLSLSVPFEVTYFDRTLNEFDYWRTGIAAIPRYQLLTEEANGIDLTLGISAYYLRTTMFTSEFSNPDHLGLGALLGVQKTLGRVSVSAGVIAQRAWNLDERDEVSGKDHMDVVSAGLNAGMPIGDRWAVNAMLLWDHTRDLPEWMDADTMTVGATTSYMVKDAWTLSLSLLSDLANEDEKRVEVHLGLGWEF